MRMKVLDQVDMSLVEQAKQSDKEALGKLYDLFVDRVYRFVYFRVGLREDAEDVTEQVFVKVVTKIKTYEDRGLPFEAWLFRIVRNQLTDFYRARRGKNVALDEAIEVIDPTPLPEERVETKLQYEAVLAQLPNLPQSYQDIILFKFVEELENEEISIIMEKPVDQVRVLQSRAIAKLKTLLSL